LNTFGEKAYRNTSRSIVMQFNADQLKKTVPKLAKLLQMSQTIHLLGSLVEFYVGMDSGEERKIVAPVGNRNPDF